MTGTPSMLAETPDRAAVDVIAHVLEGIRLSASVFLDGRFQAPFAVISPERWDGDQPIARLKHVSVFHLIADGECMFALAGSEPCLLRTGDMVLVPFTPAHHFWSGDHEGFKFGPDLLEPGPIPGVAVCRSQGGGGVETRIVCGFLESAELMPTPLFRSLPPLIVEHASADSVSGPIAATAASILQQLDAGPSPAVEIMLSRLMELLFVEMLRRHAARLPEGAKGLLAASRDPLVSKALALMHREPIRKWTVDALADEVGTSRSVLGERFARLLDMPPIEYLTGWRMQLACNQLRNTRDGLVNVAADVGYDSEAAFSRAFRRVVGISPGAWRQAA